MRNLFGFFLVIAVCVPGLTYAHFLKVDGTIGGVIHIDPNDEPVTSSVTTFGIDMKDTDGKLDLLQCDCSISVEGEAAENVHSDGNFLAGEYTFKEPGAYTIQFEGVPNTMGLFQPFVLVYDISVTEGSGKKDSFLGKHGGHIIILAGGLFIGGIFTVVENKKKVVQ